MNIFKSEKTIDIPRELKRLESIFKIEKGFQNLPTFNIKKYQRENTAIIYVDIIKGFVSEGALSSDRANNILKDVKQLDYQTPGFKKVYFVDSHTKDSVEFDSYPPHCIEGTTESEFEIKFDTANPASIVVKKNSVNGFVAPDFLQWLVENSQITNFIIVGLVTDICVMNFALTLKAYLNQWNLKNDIIIPIKMVETFELEATNHDASLMNTFALYNMQMNGIKLFK